MMQKFAFPTYKIPKIYLLIQNFPVVGSLFVYPNNCKCVVNFEMNGNFIHIRAIGF